MKRSYLNRRLPAVLLVSCVLLPALISCRKGDAPRRPSPGDLARSVVERVRKNYDFRDFTFRMTITRSFPNGARYSKTFQFFGVAGDGESKVFAKSISGPRGDATRYLMLFRDKKLVSAKMSSPSLGEVETQEGESDLNKITFGDLSYPELRHMISLQPEDLDEVTEEPDYFVLRSHVKEPPPDSESEESLATRFVYLIDKQTYLPSRIEFFNQREKFKEFNLETKGMVGDRWFVRRGTVKDFIDQSETLLEFEDVHLDEGVDGNIFREENLRSSG